LSVRVSPISRTAAILIVAVGVFVLLAGLSTGEVASDVSGVVFIALGVFLYLFLLRFTRNLGRQLEEAGKD
jgi:divalent metal cation (Fe/Co/Zn/Cd) transporter